jgi:transcriptional regulator of met regulon
MTEPIVDPNADPSKEDNPQKPTPPSDSQDDKGKNTPGEDVPEKFKGKSAAEIAKSYVELEKKLGDNEGTKKQLEQFYALADVINKNPKIKEALLEAVEGKPSDDKDKDKKNDKPDETKEVVKEGIISTFRKDLGINALDEEDRKGLLGKVMGELRDLVSESDKLSDAQVIDKIPLSSLNKYLHKAYRLATLDDEKEQSRAKGVLEAKKNAEGAFGSFSSSGIKIQKV